MTEPEELKSSQVSSSSSSSSPSAPDASPLTRTGTVKLIDGRTTHYAVGGDFSSRRIVLCLHGVFGVGDVTPSQGRWYQSRGWLCVAPTVPGWGSSDPFPKNTPVSAYVDDIRQLLDHILEHQTPQDILVFGGSYGSVWAYAVAANSPPKINATTLSSTSTSSSRVLSGITPASCLRGLFIMGGFSPFRVHTSYSKGMTWMNYLTVGSPGRFGPFSWFHGMVGKVLQSKMANNVPGSLEILRKILTGEKAMTPQERQQITEWAQQQHGLTFQEWELTMATNMSKSIVQLDGYDRVCETLNSDWGFQLQDIHFEKHMTSSAHPPTPSALLPPIRVHTGNPIPSVLPPIVICGAIRDHLAPIEMMRWVSTQIPNAQLIELEGNHISGITSLFNIMGAIIKGFDQHKQQQ